MGRKRILSALVVLMFGAGLGTYCLFTVFHIHTEPEYVLSYAENQVEDYPTTLGAYKFAELVEEKTEGRIKILVFANAELGREGEVIWQMQHGGIDFARISLSQLSSSDKKMNVLQLPYLYDNSEHMFQVLDGEIGESFLERVKMYGLIGLSWYDAGARNFYNKRKPIRRVADLEGMRIRVQESDMMVDIVESLGAVAVPSSYEEVYEGLERGRMDGAENNYPSYEAMKHYEVAEYFTVDEHTRVPEMQICSRHTWEKLAEEDRTIIMECAKESALYERDLWKAWEQSARDRVVAAGATVVGLTAEEKRGFQKAVQGIYEKYCSEDMELVEQIIRMEKNGY